jgi:histidyl-tRNA synthetase
MSQGALPGFRDFYPQELAERSHIMSAWRAVVGRYAFVEYDGPPLEPLELYTRKSGDEIVGQLYAFTDKGGREVSLRPEMTPTFARMVAARANALRKPVRWFSVPQLFRYERQQKGRLREHFQLNVDIVGEPDVTADAELLAVAIDIVRELGLGADDVVARVSDRRILHGYLQALGVAEERIPDVYAVVDKLDRQPRDVSAERLTAIGLSTAARDRVLRLPETQLDDVLEALRNPDVRRLAADFARYMGYLGALGVADFVRFDLSIVRGLAYYTGIVFELFDRKGELRAICGGGRYDRLLELVGGEPLPAVGFGFGDVVLSELLRERSLLPATARVVDYYVVTVGEDLRPRALALAHALREQGRSVVYSLKPQPVGKQFKSAGTEGAREVIVLGPAEIERGVAVVRNMESGEERQVSLEQLEGNG